MTCRSVTRDLPEYELGTLPAPRRRAVAAHLAACPACAGRAAAEASAVGVLDALRDGPVPHVDVTARIMSIVGAAPAPASDAVRPTQLGWAAAAAATLAWLVTGRLLWALPGLLRASADGAGTGGVVAAVTGALIEPVLALAGIVGRLGLVALDAAGPTLGAALVASAAAAVATGTAIVTRDLMFGPLPAAGRREELQR